MSQEEIDEVVKMTIIQTVIFAVVGRLAQSPLKQLEAKGALAGERFRLARAEAAALEKLALSLQHGNDAAAALEVVQRDRALIQREIALYQELLALGARDPKALERTGLTAEAINQQIKQLEGFAGTAGGIELSLAMKQVTPNHFQCPRAHIDEVLAAHRKSGATVEPPSAADPATGARTWTVTPRDGGGKVFVTEEMPSWSITASGKRIVAALAKVGMSEGAIYRRTDVETFPLLEVDRAVATGDAEAANRLVDRAPGLDATVKAAVVKALIEAHALPEDVRARMLKERSEIRWQMEKKNSDLIKKGESARYLDLDHDLNVAMVHLADAQERGFPYGFESMEKFREVGAALKQEIEALPSVAGKAIPTGRLAVHGSAVYRPEASDIDIAILATPAEFEVALANAFPKEIGELRSLGEDPMRATIASVHNARQRTYAKALESGKLSRDKTEPSLSELRKKIETMTDHDADLSIIRIGSTFDRGPYITFPQ
jgi:hypothetical protein